jgi:hypothetical protein
MSVEAKVADLLGVKDSDVASGMVRHAIEQLVYMHRNGGSLSTWRLDRSSVQEFGPHGVVSRPTGLVSISADGFLPAKEGE